MKYIYFIGLYDDFNIFEPNGYIYSKRYLEPHRLLYEALLNEGFEIIIPKSESDLVYSPHSIIVYDIPIEILVRFRSFKQCIKWKLKSLFGSSRQKKILYQKLMALDCKKYLVAWESPAVYPENYFLENHVYFDSICIQQDDMVDGIKYKKIFQPVEVSDNKSELPSWFDRKTLCLINSNKMSYEFGELYSARREFVEDCQKNGFDILDIWGKGWEGYQNAKGLCVDKDKTISNYKYCLCYENSHVTLGYITEKIFDCIVNGTVPIYWGAPNVSAHIPTEIFIDRRNFKSNIELVHYINDLPECAWRLMVDKGRQYLDSNAFATKWSSLAYYRNISSLFQDQ